MSDEMIEAKPIAVMSDDSHVTFWVDAGGDTRYMVRLPCLSAEHAEELVKLCHRAFGMRTKEDSFTTGLLHRDLEIICGL